MSDALNTPPIWADPSDPDKVDRSRFREPDGYEAVEWTGISSALILTTSLIISALGDGLSEEEVQPLIKAQKEITEKATAFWKKLEKGDMEELDEYTFDQEVRG